MSDVIKGFRKIPTSNQKSVKNSQNLEQEASISPAKEVSDTSLDPRIARRVMVSLIKHHEALEYLKNQ